MTTPPSRTAPPKVTWQVKAMPHPFLSPRPPVEHQPYASFGDDTVHRRTPEQIRETMNRRVGRWLDIRFEAVPPHATREDMIAFVFGEQGWITQARIADVSDRWPMHGWLLTHPEHGVIVYADKNRDGDLGPDFVARNGPWGGLSRLIWAYDVPGLFAQGVPTLPPQFPHTRTARKLLAHAYRTATPDEQTCTDLILALTGCDLPAFLHEVDADNLSVLPA